MPKDAPLPWGQRALLLSSGTARVVWIEPRFASHPSLGIREQFPASPQGFELFCVCIWGAGTELQAFCNATSLDANVQSEAGARGTEFAQPHACQNFLNSWLILAGIDGEVALGDIQLGDAGSKVDGEVGPLHLKDGG